MLHLTQDLMQDPVVASDGYSYERAAIEKWLLTRDTSPMTNAPLGLKVGHGLSQIFCHII